jgi:hypothetical protein
MDSRAHAYAWLCHTEAEEKEKARERARNRERRQEQKFLQQWNDQAFKLAPSTSAAEVARHLEQIYSLPAKRFVPVPCE